MSRISMIIEIPNYLKPSVIWGTTKTGPDMKIDKLFLTVMTAQLGFLEPLEWTQETQNDFSISRLGGLPVRPIPHENVY